MKNDLIFKVGKSKAKSSCTTQMGITITLMQLPIERKIHQLHAINEKNLKCAFTQKN